MLSLNQEQKKEKEETLMTNHEIIKRLGRLDIRDADREDYEALYLAIEMIKGFNKVEIKETTEEMI